MRMISVTILSLLFGAGASADARAGLADEEDINAGLLAVAIADKIRRECDDISGRFFVARKYANGLKAMAEDRGYTYDEIETYVNDSAEKKKMRERRNAYFHSQGASNLDAQSLCVLGRAEIQKQSRIGSFLKAK